MSSSSPSSALAEIRALRAAALATQINHGPFVGRGVSSSQSPAHSSLRPSPKPPPSLRLRSSPPFVLPPQPRQASVFTAVSQPHPPPHEPSPLSVTQARALLEAKGFTIDDSVAISRARELLEASGFVVLPPETVRALRALGLFFDGTDASSTVDLDPAAARRPFCSRRRSSNHSFEDEDITFLPPPHPPDHDEGDASCYDQSSNSGNASELSDCSSAHSVGSDISGCSLGDY